MTYVCPSCQAQNDDAAETCFTCGSALSATLRLGSVIAGRYEIQAQLGKGGMGVVYRAHDRLLDEQVAIKVLRPEVARDAEISRRFQSEIKLARRVSHKNVCRIHEYGEDQGLRYISMEYMQGVDLRQVIRERGGLPTDEAFASALQIADGLSAIHDVGVIHRDLKTPNIMRDTRGQIRLMDFGIAKEWGAAAASATATGLVMGTPEYMSPEQARGEKIDFRSDIYALGIVIFELFTGRLPFRAETPLATILKHLQEAPPLDGPEGVRIPPPVREVLRKALAKNPNERHTTVEELGQAMREARAGRGADPQHAIETMMSASAPSPTTYIPTPVPTAHTYATEGALAAEPASFPTPTAMRPPSHTAIPTVAPTLLPPAAPAPRRAAPTTDTPPPARVPAAPSRTGLYVGLGAAGLLVFLAVGGLLGWKVWQAMQEGGGTTPSTTLTASSVPTLPPATIAPAPPTTLFVPAETPPPPPETTVAPATRPTVAPATVPPRTTPPVTMAPPPTAPPAPAVPAEVVELMAGLEDRDANARWKAAEALGNLGGQARAAVPALIELLGDQQEVVRWRTAEALGKIGPDAARAVPALIRTLSGTGLAPTEAAKALGRIGPPARDSVPSLAAGLGSSDVYFRREIAKALARMGGDGASAVPALTAALRDKDKVVRMESAKALGRMGGAARAAVPALTAATKDSDDLVKRAAALALEQVQAAP
jgi:serine/threonine protein kinase/HEAT repeat protein